jgi:hypothetical protein
MDDSRLANSAPEDDVDILRAEHEALELRLHELEKLRTLTPEEQYEKQVIKKRKLAIKDRIFRLES